MVARKAIIEAVDVELFESRYPALVTEKRPRPGEAGAGRHRAGAGCQMIYQPHGVEQIDGVMLGMREWLPLPGFAGGMPGANTEFAIHRRDGRRDVVSGHASGVVVREDEQFEFRIGSGGGLGDPLDREPAEVARDVRHGRITAAEAEATYGVMLVADQADPAATTQRRAQILKSRLTRSIPARKPGPRRSLETPLQGQPLYPGVVQVGTTAYAVLSGAALALAPDPWTDGCPTLEELRGNRLLIRSYLDPVTGRLLLVDVLPRGESCTIATRPRRWQAPAPGS
jgi:N-methylhydantoinase B